jgi:hypothetical protein
LANNGLCATTVGVLAIAWFLAVQLFTAGVVGAIWWGRLRTRWVGVHSDEVFFRDTAHGLLVWALGTIVSAVVFASTVSAVASGAAQAGGAALPGAGQALSSAAGASSAMVKGNGNGSGEASGTGPLTYFTDMLFRSDHPGQADETAAKTEMGQILFRALANGNLSDADKSYVAQLVSRQTGISQADAEKRIDDVMAQAKAAAQQAADKAQQAADTARKVAVSASLWAFVGLLIGAFSASYMATIGGRLRDDLPALG